MKHKLSTEYKKAGRIERDWSKTALDEAASERQRGLKYPKGDPMRDELLMDAKIAQDFYKWRLGRSRSLRKTGKKLKMVGL